MTQRITESNINHAVISLTKALRALDMIPYGASVMVHAGSKSSGVSWRLELRDADSKGIRSTVPGIDLHGCYTAREAYERITTASFMAWATFNAQQAHAPIADAPQE